ncbi:MAG: oxidoreductase [Pseudooceanicola sp.]|nr:oxidoreductase [Pseudooceanicola sp.]
MTLRWGILGASNFARAFMGPAIHAARQSALVALATSSAEKAIGFSAFCSDLRVHSDYDALLADPDIDAVYIPLPNTLHIDWTLKALDAGKHVLCEKPIAMAASDIDRLIAKSDETGLLAAEAYMIVHHPQWLRAREMLRDGAIGRLAHVEGTFTYNNRDAANIRNKAEMGGGGIADIGVYTYGATRWMTGQEPEAITHADLTYENGVDVVARVSARFPGFTAQWMNSTRMYPMQQMTFIGDAGAIRLTAPFNANVYGEARVELHQPDLGLRVERFPAANHYILQVEAFSRSVRDGEPFGWPLEQARGTQAMIDAIHTHAKGV